MPRMLSGPGTRSLAAARWPGSASGSGSGRAVHPAEGGARCAALEPRRRPGEARCTRSLVVCAASGSKVKTTFECLECGGTVPQWQGKCPHCDAWATLSQVEVFEEPKGGKGGGGGGGIAAARSALAPARRPADGAPPAAGPPHAPRDGNGAASPPPPARQRRGGWVDGSDRPQRIADISRRGFGSHWRLPLAGDTGEELARVLGGGVVPGSMTLIGGDPGVGKSTLLLQLAGILARIPPLQPPANGGGEPVADTQAVLYVSAEESVEQVGSRAERMGLAGEENVFLLNETRVTAILRETVAMRPRAVIVDSIQTVYLEDVTGSAGSVSQVREAATALLHMAKRERVPVFLVGHVTKAGDIAGPRVLEHIVDAVLYLEGERHQTFRLLRGIKNRYGATDEVGVFMMGEAGLSPVANPSALFLSDRSQPGGVSSAVSVVIEGTRPLLVEIQALCTPTHAQATGGPLRAPTGMNRNRLLQVLAVLSKHAGVKTYKVDIHASVVGGLTLTEPATDLAVAVAVASSVAERPVPPDMAFIGELGLGGELRMVSHLQRRVQEAAKLGFLRCVVPRGDRLSARAAGGMRLLPCSTIGAALHECGILG